MCLHADNFIKNRTTGVNASLCESHFQQFRKKKKMSILSQHDRFAHSQILWKTLAVLYISDFPDFWKPTNPSLNVFSILSY